MVELRGITWDHPRGYQPLVACSQIYAASTGIQVTWERRSLKDFGDLPIDQLAADYDLLIIDHPHVGLASSSGCLTPLETLLSPATLENLSASSAGPSHDSYLYGGSQWGLAIDAAMQVASYRPNLVEALPTAWDDALALAAELRRRGLWMATALCPTDSICGFLTLCANLGAPLGAQWVNNATATAALDLLAEICAASHAMSLDANPIAVLDAMSSGDDIAYCPFSFCYTNYGRDGFRPYLVQYGPIPGVSGSILGGAGIAVSAFSNHQDSAGAFCAWVCSDSVQSGPYVEHGGQPGYRAAWLNPQANTLTHGFFQSTLPSLEQAYVRPRYAGFVTFQEQAGRIINTWLRDKSSTQSCLEALEAAFWSSQEGRRNDG
jgi:multiple sugar transport system substrate-binding protein